MNSLDFKTISESRKLVVLIDADNAQATTIEEILIKIGSFGEAIVKRIYGDFTNTSSTQWKKILNKFGIKPIQQFAYTTGKNATDSMLIIDAMDLLYTKRFDGFCIVSSDSDFTAIAMRIREEGLTVYGFGEDKTPESFRNICNQFISIESLKLVKVATEHPKSSNENNSINLKEVTKDITVKPTNINISSLFKPEEGFPTMLFYEAIEKSCNEDGWAHIGLLGTFLKKIKPDFDPRIYGYKNLSSLIKAKNHLFEIQEKAQPNSNAKTLFLRAKSIKKFR